MKDIRDAYPGDVDGKRIDSDVKALSEEGHIYALTVAENKARSRALLRGLFKCVVAVNAARRREGRRKDAPRRGAVDASRRNPCCTLGSRTTTCPWTTGSGGCGS